MKFIAQLFIFSMMLVLLSKIPIFLILLRFSSGTVFPALETPSEGLIVMARILQGNSAIWYRGVNCLLLILDVLALVGLAGYPAYLLSRQQPGKPPEDS